MRKFCFIISALLCTLTLQAQQQQTKQTNLLTSEKWWASGQYPTMLDNSKQCIDKKFTLLVSSAGRYIWSQTPFSAYCNNGQLITTSDQKLEIVSAGKTLKEAYITAHYKHLSKNNQTVDKSIFQRPIYEMAVSDQDNFSQEDIVNRAQWLIKEGFPKGVIVLDNRWQQSFGTFKFDTERFPAPENMISKLNALGFDVMLSVVPFVSPDSRIVRDQNNNGNIIVGGDGQPKLIKWVRGYSCCYDLNKMSVSNMIAEKLNELRTKYKISGFRFENINTHCPEQADAWNTLANSTKGNISTRVEKETMFEIVYDDSTIEGVRDFVSRVLAFGLSGKMEFVVSFSTPTNSKNILNRIRFQSLMPIMQLNIEELVQLSSNDRQEALNAVKLHNDNIPYLESLLTTRSTKGDPVIRPIEYEYPRKGFADCQDQFMIGEKYIIAPLSSDNRSRTLRLPNGVWFDANNKRIKGPIVKDINYDNYPTPVFRHK